MILFSMVYSGSKKEILNFVIYTNAYHTIELAKSYTVLIVMYNEDSSINVAHFLKQGIQGSELNAVIPINTDTDTNTMEFVRSIENGIIPWLKSDTNRRFGPDIGRIPTNAPRTRRSGLL